MEANRIDIDHRVGNDSDSRVIASGVKTVKFSVAIIVSLQVANG